MSRGQQCLRRSSSCKVDLHFAIALEVAADGAAAQQAAKKKGPISAGRKGSKASSSLAQCTGCQSWQIKDTTDVGRTRYIRITQASERLRRASVYATMRSPGVRVFPQHHP
ncbi:hypothetical protein WJX82_002857 [Trebouxia sp. C0006]